MLAFYLFKNSLKNKKKEKNRGSTTFLWPASAFSDPAVKLFKHKQDNHNHNQRGGQQDPQCGREGRDYVEKLWFEFRHCAVQLDHPSVETSKSRIFRAKQVYFAQILC